MRATTMKSQYLETMKDEWISNKEGLLSKAPLYHQLYSLLKTSILDGTLNYEDRMPTEQELESTFDVSRITAKRAMDELASDNLIKRQRGRGSHVKFKYKPKPVSAPLIEMLENLVEMGIHSVVKVISISDVTPPARIAKFLSLNKDQTVKRVVRVRSNEQGEAFAHYVSWTVGISHGFTKENLESTPRLEIIKANKIKLIKIKQTLGAENATNDIALQLDMKEGDALLSITRQSLNDEDQIVDVIDCLYNPKLFNYSMVLSLD